MKLTILTSLKPPQGGAARIQSVALANWRERLPSCEIITFEGEPPLFTEVVRRSVASEGDVVIYANADILFAPEIATIVRWCAAQKRDYLIVGQRTDILEGGQREVHRPSGIDYFIFRKGMFVDLPETRIGRAYYDSALLAYCMRRKVRVIDATRVLEVLHQYHDYGHLAGGRKEVFGGAAAMANKRANHLPDFGPHIADVREQFIWEEGWLEVVPKHVNILRRLGLWGLWNRIFRGGLGFWGIHWYCGRNGACFLTRCKVEKWSPNSNVRQRFNQVVDAPSGVWTGFDFPCMWAGWREARRTGKEWTLFLWDPPSLGHRDKFPPLRWAIDAAFRWFARRCDRLVLNIHPGLLEEIGYVPRKGQHVEFRMQDAFEGLEPSPIVELSHYEHDIGILSKETNSKGVRLISAALKELPHVTCKWVYDKPQEEAFNMLQKCRVLVVPYLPVRSLKWNYPLKLFEYLQLGRPILASDNPGNAAVAARFPEHIWLFKSGDVHSFVDAVKTLLTRRAQK